MIKPSEIIEINAYVNNTDNPTVKSNMLESALSSWHYYNSAPLKVSSIIRGLIKNHPFYDGNKRTAVFVLFILSEQHKINILLNDTDLEEFVVSIASSKLSVEEISSVLFGNN